MFTARILPLALVLAAPAFAQDQEKPKHLLRFNFKEGTVAQQVMTQDMTMNMDVAGQKMTTKMTMDMFQTFTIKSVKGNKADIEQKITRVKAAADGPMQVDFDSDDKDSDPGMLGGLADLVGQKTSMTLDDRGKTSNVKIPDDMKDAGGVNLEEMMSQIVTSMPEQPVAVGETWTVKQALPLGQMGDTDTEITYKLVSVNEKNVVLEQQLKMNLDEMEGPGGMEVKSAKASGKVTIDRMTGLPSNSTLQIKLEMGGQMGSVKMEVGITMKPAPAKKPAPKKEAGDAAKSDAGKTDGGK
jgi:hypothetical protein